jgi:hypothetical protein
MVAGRFRTDLFYRLCSDVVRTPTLCEQLDDRPEDLTLLLRFIARRTAGAAADAVAQEVHAWIERELADYAWPGNFRELEQCARNVIARGDWPIQILAEAARAIYWFNPLFWILVRRLRQASEHAADNIVLGLGVGQTEYARDLLEVAQELGAGARQGPILAVAQPSFLERRLIAVLNPRLKRVAAAPWATLLIVTLAVGVSIPLATLRDASTGAAASGDSAEASPAPGAASAALGAACPVTPTQSEAPPSSELADAFGDGPWHVNDDRSIWVWAQPYAAERTVSAIWIRPEGTQLSVTAERLDGAAPPIDATFDCCVPRIFKSGGIQFPTAGCWRVDAVAGDRRLSFVTEVLP